MNDESKLAAFCRSMTKLENDEILRMQEQADALIAAREQSTSAKQLREDTCITEARAEALRLERTGDARASIAVKQMLLGLRETLTREVFDEAREQLCAFALSPAYADYLCVCARRLAEIVPCDGATLCVRAEDFRYEALLRSAWAVPLVQDDRIHIGGARAENLAHGLIADETLDTALLAQMEWFRAHVAELLTKEDKRNGK